VTGPKVAPPTEPLDQGAMKRIAIQQSIMLPTDYAEAMAVLGHMRDIVMWQAGLVGPAPVAQGETEAVVVGINSRSRSIA
jgi:hypothetical protein